MTFLFTQRFDRPALILDAFPLKKNLLTNTPLRVALLISENLKYIFLFCPKSSDTSTSLILRVAASHFWNNFSIDNFRIYDRLEGENNETVRQLVCHHGNIIHPAAVWNEWQSDYWSCSKVKCLLTNRFMLQRAMRCCYSNNPRSPFVQQLTDTFVISNI